MFTSDVRQMFFVGKRKYYFGTAVKNGCNETAIRCEEISVTEMLFMPYFAELHKNEIEMNGTGK